MIVDLRSLLLASIAIALVPFPCSASGALRASYEIVLSVGGETYSTRSAETLGAGGSITQELGAFQVVIQPEVESSGSYNLQVSVTPVATSPASIAVSVERIFPGVLGGPLEFSGEFGDARVSGAIMLVTLPGES